MIKVTSFYRFFSIEQPRLKVLQAELLKKAKALNVRGLILIGTEGVNATLAGKEKDLESYKRELERLFQKEFSWKDSECDKWNFRRISVKIKKEIINLGSPGFEQIYNESRLSPQEWEEKIQQKAQVLDIRNRYEWEIGQFKGAQTLDIDNFQEFPDKLEALPIDKSRETLIYCTGGIRCEKALKVMKDKGFQKVYQLEGGILNYLKDFPNSQFENECFVFDHRVAVDQDLKPSRKYSLCPHCGQPGGLKILCKHCQKPSLICKLCRDKSPHYETCSKNCAYHHKSGHICRKKHRSDAHSPTKIS